jgi:hypothetical protein
MKILGYRVPGNPGVVQPTDVEITPTKVINHGVEIKAVSTGKMNCKDITVNGSSTFRKGFGMGVQKYDGGVLPDITMVAGKFLHIVDYPFVTNFHMPDGTELGTLVAIKKVFAGDNVIVTPDTPVPTYATVTLFNFTYVYMVWTTYGWTWLSTSGIVHDPLGGVIWQA